MEILISTSVIFSRNFFIVTPTPGFAGRSCTENIDECLSNPCISEATQTCIDGIFNYTCDCLPGYRGRHCEVNIDECEMHGCLNGASCMDAVNGYRYGTYCRNWVLNFFRMLQPFQVIFSLEVLCEGSTENCKLWTLYIDLVPKSFKNKFLG